MSLRNSLLVLLFGGTLGFLLLREQEHGTLERFDRVHREFLKANPGGAESGSVGESAVVLARLDDIDQPNRIFAGWPLVEADWQIVLENVAGFAPKSIAIAAPLPFGQVSGPLESAARALPSLTVGAAASAAPGEGADKLPGALATLNVTGSVAAIPEFKSVITPPLPGVSGVRDIDLIDRDRKPTVEGDWCRVPLLARMGERVVPSLALRALLEWAGIPLSEVRVQPGVAITAGKSMRIEIDEGGFFRFYLSLAPVVPSVNADMFVLTRDQAMKELPANDPQRSVLERLPKCLLWIGPDHAGARLLKLPNGTPVSPDELMARAIAAIQTASYMRPLPPSRHWILPAATLLFCLWLTNWRKSRLWPGALTAAVILIGISLWFYRQDHQWIPLVPSLALVAATLILSYVLPSPAKPVVGGPDAPPPSAGSRSKPAPSSTRSKRSTRRQQPVDVVQPTSGSKPPVESAVAEPVGGETPAHAGEPVPGGEPPAGAEAAGPVEPPAVEEAPVATPNPKNHQKGRSGKKRRR